MINCLDLKTRWRQMLDRAPEAEESVSILFENDWVRILAIRNKDTPEQKRIEVEVSLPSKIDSESGKEVKIFMQNLIKHLEYLLCLDDEGLTLGVLSRDGLWTAYLEVDTSPPDSLFRALVPPSL